MRAKVASRARGHVFEKKFMDLEGIQLSLAYRQAIKDEKEQMDIVTALHKNWVTRIEDSVKALMLFTNPSLYKSWEDLKDISKHQDELKVEEFPEVWEELMKIIPQEVYVEDVKPDPLVNVPTVNPEISEFFTGFVPYNQRKKVTDHGNE